jgi:tetratricopeptide (TPR) repeat protein
LQKDRLERAFSLAQERRYDEAVILLESVLQAEPVNSAALTQLAFCQLRRRQPRLALLELDKAESVDGVTARTARMRADALSSLRRYREARAAYREADALGDRTSWNLVQLARCCLRLNDLEGARGAAARAVERGPEDAAAWVVLGDVAARADDAAQAESAYLRATELKPGDGYAYARLIECRLLQLEPLDRKREVELLLKSTGGDNPHLLQLLARLQSELGDAAAAAAAWRKSRRRVGRSGSAYALRMEGFALKRAGSLPEAAAVLRESLMMEPENVIAFQGYVRLQQERGAFGELRETLQELLPIAGTRRGAIHGELRKLPSEGEPHR